MRDVQRLDASIGVVDALTVPDTGLAVPIAIATHRLRYQSITMLRSRTAHFHRLENLVRRFSSDFDFSLRTNATAI
jgi:hypothetical protein